MVEKNTIRWIGVHLLTFVSSSICYVSFWKRTKKTTEINFNICLFHKILYSFLAINAVYRYLHALANFPPTLKCNGASSFILLLQPGISLKVQKGCGQGTTAIPVTHSFPSLRIFPLFFETYIRWSAQSPQLWVLASAGVEVEEERNRPPYRITHGSE